MCGEVSHTGDKNREPRCCSGRNAFRSTVFGVFISPLVVVVLGIHGRRRRRRDIRGIILINSKEEKREVSYSPWWCSRVPRGGRFWREKRILFARYETTITTGTRKHCIRGGCGVEWDNKRNDSREISAVDDKCTRRLSVRRRMW